MQFSLLILICRHEYLPIDHWPYDVVNDITNIYNATRLLIISNFDPITVKMHRPQHPTNLT